MRKRWFLVQYVTFSIKTKQTDFYIRNIHRSIGILLKIIDKYFFFGNASKRVLRPSANIKKGQKKGKGKNEGVIIVRKHAKKVKKKVRKKRKMTSTNYSFLHHFEIC